VGPILQITYYESTSSLDLFLITRGFFPLVRKAIKAPNNQLDDNIAMTTAIRVSVVGPPLSLIKSIVEKQTRQVIIINLT